MSNEKLLKLVNVLQSHDVDAKVDALAALQKEFEITAEVSDWESVLHSLKLCLHTSNQLLSAAALSTLLPYLSLLLNAQTPPGSSRSHASWPPQDPYILRQVFSAILTPGGVFERLGDRERPQLKARQIVVLLGEASSHCSPLPCTQSASKGREKNNETPMNIFERHLRELGLGSKVWKIREQSILILRDIRRAQSSFPLRSFVAQLVVCLEDTDAHVRDTTRQAVIEMFSTATEMARTDLKKEMTKKNVRKAIVDSVLNQLLSASANHAPQTLDDAPSRTKEYIPPSVALSNSRRPTASNSDDMIGNKSGTTPYRPASRSETSTPLATPAVDSVQVQPVYVTSTRDLETELAELVRPFEGKETEHNWPARERSILRIRGMLSGGVTVKYPDAFRLQLKDLLPITLKTLNSLRTTVCVNTCALYSELALHLGPMLEPHCDILLSNLLRLSNSTKKLFAQKSQAAVSALILHVSPNPRTIISLLHNTLQEKNVQSRTYATSHLREYLSIHAAGSRTSLEATGALDTLVKATRKALADPNPAVKETARDCFWLLQPLWPEKAIEIHSALDLIAQNQLDRACPHFDKGPILPAPSRPTKKTSVAAAIAASRARAKANAAAPPTSRPQAMSQPSVGVDHRVSSPAPINGRSQLESQGSPSPSRSSRTDTAHMRALSSSRSFQTPSPPNMLLVKSTLPHLSPSTDNRSGSPPQHIVSAPVHPVPTSAAENASPTHSSWAPALSTAQTVSDVDLQSSTPISVPVGPPIDHHPVVDLETNMATLRPHSDQQSSGGNIPPIPSSVVEEALRCRAEQAESAAERLLELVDQEEVDVVASVAHYEQTPVPSAHMFATPSTPKRKSITDNASSSILQQAALFQDSPLRTLGSAVSVADKSGNKSVDVLSTRQGETGWSARRLALLSHRPEIIPADVAQKQEQFGIDVDHIVTGDPHTDTFRRLIHFCSDTAPPTRRSTSSAPRGLLSNGLAVDNRGNGVVKLFDALLVYLAPEKPAELLEAGLILLWEILEHQFAEMDGREAEIFAVLLRVRYSADPHVLEATNMIRDTLIPKMEPVYGLTTMHASLRAFSAVRVGDSSNGVRYSTFAFGLIALGKFVLRLPPEVAEEELPRLKETLTASLNEKESLVVREAAAAAVIAAQLVMQDETQLFALLDGLADEKKNLLAYLFDKHSARPASSMQNGAGTGGRDKLQKEMKRLDRRTSLVARV